MDYDDQAIDQFYTSNPAGQILWRLSQFARTKQDPSPQPKRLQNSLHSTQSILKTSSNYVAQSRTQRSAPTQLSQQDRITREFIISVAFTNLLEQAFTLRQNTQFLIRCMKEALNVVHGHEQFVPCHSLAYLCMISKEIPIRMGNRSSALILMDTIKKCPSRKRAFELIPGNEIVYIDAHSVLFDDVGYLSRTFNYSNSLFTNDKYFIHWRRVSDLVYSPSLYFLHTEKEEGLDKKVSVEYTDLDLNLEGQSLLVLLVCLLTKMSAAQFEKTYFLKPYEPNHHVSVALFDTKGDAQQREVICDDLVPCLPFHLPVGLYTEKPNQVWVWLLEKALAKLMGSYENLWQGTPENLLPILTGTDVKSIDFSVWEILYFHWTSKHDMIVLGTESGPRAVIIEIVEHQKKLFIYEPRKKKHSWVLHDDAKRRVSRCWISSMKNL